ncbi:MAG TPA: tetratricopeptide repeat protein [Xanthobacteraceae bacterium]|jgi:TPR repeat protein|nr:tetratricopeptide repeat protein [Xanthobacteraceae bacterium]
MHRLSKSLFVSAALALGGSALAHADGLSAGRAAYARADYVAAARLLIPLAEQGNAAAQALLGFMYANGRGVPQGYGVATFWYRLAADQGDTTAQYLLGLMYDKGFGVPLDEVAAHMWLNLAAAHAPPRNRDYYVRLRDAVATKMTPAQIAEAQWRAQAWVPIRRSVAEADPPAQ